MFKKTVNYKGEKTKVLYNNTFNFGDNKEEYTNKIHINGKIYFANCLPKYAGWEFEGIKATSEKKLVELIINKYGI